MPACDDCPGGGQGECRRSSDADYIPVDHAKRALQAAGRRANWTSAEHVLTFHRMLSDLHCPGGWISVAEFRALLFEVAYMPMWGRGGSEVLVKLLVERVGRRYFMRPGEEPGALYEMATSLIDQFLGRLPDEHRRRARYDPSFGKSFASFVFDRLLWQALKVYGQPPAEADEELVTPPVQLEGFVAALVHRPVGEAAGYLQRAQAFERRVLGLLRKLLEGEELSLTDTRRRNYLRAVSIAERGINGEPGYCTLLSSEIGAASDVPALNLATSLSNRVAESAFRSTNGTMLMKGVVKWLNEALKLASDAGHCQQLAEWMRSAMTLRLMAHSLLDRLTGLISRLSPDDIAKRANQWRGPPTRDLTDPGNGGAEGVGGYGIANVPFAFGLIDPLGDNTDGLDRLLIDDPDPDPSQP